MFLVFLGAICFGMLDDSYKTTNVSRAWAHNTLLLHSFMLQPDAHTLVSCLIFPTLGVPINLLFPFLLSLPLAAQAYQACLWVGLATLANGLFNCFIICSHPGFQHANRDSVMAAAGVEGGE